jgi:hypothetical protein
MSTDDLNPASPNNAAMRYWIGVASADHVRAGVAGGFAQLAHGKHAPIRRLSPGDRILYYSPKSAYPEGDPVQAFTAIGQVRKGEAYQARMADGFEPWRRDVAFLPQRDAPIRPLIARLGFIRDKVRWGAVFRCGVVEIPRADFLTIARAMLDDAAFADVKG